MPSWFLNKSLAGDTNSLRVKEGAFTSATKKWYDSEVRKRACLLIFMDEQSRSVSAEVVSLITREAKTRAQSTAVRQTRGPLCDLHEIDGIKMSGLAKCQSQYKKVLLL